MQEAEAGQPLPPGDGLPFLTEPPPQPEVRLSAEPLGADGRRPVTLRRQVTRLCGRCGGRRRATGGGRGAVHRGRWRETRRGGGRAGRTVGLTLGGLGTAEGG